MIRRHFLKLVAIFLAVLQRTSSAGTVTGFASVIEGKVFGYDDEVVSPLQGVKITAYHGTNEADATSSEKDGTFKLTIKNNRPVTLTFVLSGYGTGTCISVGVPANQDSAVVHVTLIKGGNDTRTLRDLQKLLQL